MRYILVVEKNIFSCALDPDSPYTETCIEFLNVLALKKAEKGYKIAIIPLSLIDVFDKSRFFKNARTIELIKDFIDIESSVFSDNLDEDYFEVCRVNTDKQPIIVTNREDVTDFRGQHTTPIMTPGEALRLIREVLESF